MTIPNVGATLADILVKAGLKTTAATAKADGYNVAWIRELRQAFEDHYRLLGMTVRSRHSPEGKHDEFLYDLMVCRAISGTLSPEDGKRRQQDIGRIGRPEWQVESELSNNSRHIAHDFNKLLIGGATHKLMICGLRGGTRSCESQTEALNEFFKKLMEDFNGISLFVAYLTPWRSKWTSGESPVKELWDFSKSVPDPITLRTAEQMTE